MDTDFLLQNFDSVPAAHFSANYHVQDRPVPSMSVEDYERYIVHHQANASAQTMLSQEPLQEAGSDSSQSESSCSILSLGEECLF